MGRTRRDVCRRDERGSIRGSGERFDSLDVVESSVPGLVPAIFHSSGRIRNSADVYSAGIGIADIVPTTRTRVRGVRPTDGRTPTIAERSRAVHDRKSSWFTVFLLALSVCAPTLSVRSGADDVSADRHGHRQHRGGRARRDGVDHESELDRWRAHDASRTARASIDFPRCSPASTQLTAELQGFRTVTRDDIRLPLGADDHAGRRDGRRSRRRKPWSSSGPAEHGGREELRRQHADRQRAAAEPPDRSDSSRMSSTSRPASPTAWRTAAPQARTRC